MHAPRRHVAGPRRVALGPSARTGIGLLSVHTPAMQVWVSSQRLLSVQAVPLTLTGFEHVPSVGSQTPAVWHWSGGAHAIGVPPWQMPPRQVGLTTQAPSEQGALLLVCAQTPLVHVSVMQGLLLLHWAAEVQPPPDAQIHESLMLVVPPRL